MKKIIVDGVEFIYNCTRMSDCWAYKYGGCCGNRSKCYDAPQDAKVQNGHIAQQAKSAMPGSK